MGGSEKIPLLVIAGPTACGKTALGIQIAKALRGEVVSADSMQIYRGMPIATAQPSLEETRGVPHHLIGVLDPSQRCSAARYCAMAHNAIQDIHKRGNLPIMVGGTGLYIESVACGRRWAKSETDEAAREAIQKRIAQEGGETLWRELQAIDPQAAKRIHPHDGKRLTRALELAGQGMTITEQNAFSHPPILPYRAKMLLILPRDRQILYDRINRRTERMLQNGLLEEARTLRERGVSQTAAQAIGHKELNAYFAGEVSLDEAIERIQRETRRYAKRQISWFSRMAREWNEHAANSCITYAMENLREDEAIATAGEATADES
ncbi:MAG: tRNA (adenosine(37)-N6)-dimethylallyltransferase MiaA [Oscillospiraceae bacterium]|nr:tRNA (adenosine(37)-N6)-dimethylallyltransferase MiaA [Oscillospiraceae bacterium]